MLLRPSTSILATAIAGAFSLQIATAQTVISLVPVGTGVGGELIPGAAINGDEITLPAGALPVPVFLEFRVGDWDPLEIGNQLAAWQITFDASGYTSGTQGELTAYTGPGGIGGGCEGVNDNEPCMDVLGPGTLCDPPGYFYPTGTCAFVFIDRIRPDYIYADAGGPISTVDVSQPNVRPAGTVIFGAPDDPVPYPPEGLYAGTLVVWVPVDARGTFTLGLQDFPATQLVRAGDSQFIKPIVLESAKITIEGDDCTPTIGLTGMSHACDDSLPRVGRNVVRFEFDAPITTPNPGEIEIRELLPDGAFGAEDLSELFEFSVEGGNVLRVAEDGCHAGICGINPDRLCANGPDIGLPCGEVLENETWYAVMNTGSWCGVAEFQAHYAVVFGDANNDRVSGFTDLSAINANMSPPEETPDDSRFDINTVGGVSFIDLSASNAFNGSIALTTKPSGHPCPALP